MNNLPDQISKDILQRSADPLKDFDWKNATPEELNWAKDVEKNMKDRKPVVDDFRKQNINISSLTMLQTRENYENEEVIILCIKWFPKVENYNLQGSLLSAILANKFFDRYKAEIIPMAIIIWKKTEPEKGGLLRNTIAYLLCKFYNDKYFAEVADLLTAKDSHFPSEQEMDSHGRFYLIAALSKTKKYKEQAARIIEQTPVTLSTIQETIKALGKLNQKSSIPYLERFLNDDRKDVKELSKKMIDKIKHDLR